MSTVEEIKQVTVEIDGVSSKEASLENIKAAISSLLEDYHRKATELLDDQNNTADQSDMSSEEKEPLSQPEALRLSDDEQCSIHLQRPETNAAARNEWPTIQAALEKNPEFMQALKAHEDMGAELTIVEVETDDDGKITAVGFENAADHLDLGAQETALAVLTDAQRGAYIQDRVSQFDEDDQAEAETWIRQLLERPSDASGLNYIEADMLMWTHGGGRLISHDSLRAQVERKPELWESTLTWYEGNLAEIKKSGLAWDGLRLGGLALQRRDGADYRNSFRGGRVSRLRVQIS